MENSSYRSFMDDTFYSFEEHELYSGSFVSHLADDEEIGDATSQMYRDHEQRMVELEKQMSNFEHKHKSKK